jgi:hypothetical protein
MQQAASLGDFGAKPLIVLTAGIGSDSAHLASQDELATLSTNAVHRTFQDSDHEGLVADEHHSAGTTRAVLDVVASVRSSGQLTG